MKDSTTRPSMRNLKEYLHHIGVQVQHEPNRVVLFYADANGSPSIKGTVTFEKLMAALKVWPGLRAVASRTVLVGALIGIDVPGGKRIFPRE